MDLTSYLQDTMMVRPSLQPVTCLNKVHYRESRLPDGLSTLALEVRTSSGEQVTFHDFATLLLERRRRMAS